MAESPDFIPDDQFIPDAEPKQANIAPISPSEAPDFIPDDKFKADDEDESAPDFIPDNPEPDSDAKDKILTGIESVGRGATFGLGDALAKGMRKGASALGLPDEYLKYIAPDTSEISARKERNPIESGVGEMAGSLLGIKNLPQIGSKAVNMMIQMGLISGGDEISKAILGQGDPLPAAAAHIAGNGALGLFGGAILGKAENLGLKAIENIKLGNKAKSFLSGLGHAASYPGPTAELSEINNSSLEGLNETLFKRGQDAYKTIGPTLGGFLGQKYAREHNQSALLGMAAGAGIEHGLAKIAGPFASKLSEKYVGPALLKASATGSIENLGNVLDHISSVSKGNQKIINGVESVFSNKGIDFAVPDKEREKLKKFIESGGVEDQVKQEKNEEDATPTEYAHGGKVEAAPITKHNPIAKIWPEQNILINSAKARVSGYLNSIRPVPNTMKKPYDTDHKDPQRERDYNKAIDLAINPLSILHHVKHGSLVPKQVDAFKSMYPELHQHLSNKLNERIASGHLDEDKKPPYKVRQSLSLFLGSDMDSSLSPASIMAAQAVFHQQNAQKQQAANNKSSLSKLGQNAMTPEQSREKRLNKN